MLIEGKNVVFEALKNNNTINNLVVLNGLNDNESKDIINFAKQKKIKISYVDKNTINRLSKTKKHQGFIAEVIDFQYVEVSDLIAESEKRFEHPFFVILDGISDPHNFGAIIRSCECAGVQGIIIPKNRSVAVNSTVMKTSAGAIANVKIARVSNVNNTINFLKKKGIWVYGCEANGSNIYNTNLTGPVAVVIGSEGFGISKLTKAKCDKIISLPLKGSVNSLNASVATGVVLYEILRQRG